MEWLFKAAIIVNVLLQCVCISIVSVLLEEVDILKEQLYGRSR